MFWGAIQYNRKGPLVVLPGDPESKKGGVTSAVYRDHLEEYIPTLLHEGTIFMHDNAPIHSAKIIKEYFQEQNIVPLGWPPYSPDLNPIENIWSCLKERFFKFDPQMAYLTSNAASLLYLEEVAMRVWDEIEIELINRVVDSMPRRLAAVIASNGWYTKY